MQKRENMGDAVRDAKEMWSAVQRESQKKGLEN